MNKIEIARRVFEEQMQRIQDITGKQTQLELADFLGIRQSSISDARRLGKIPADWLITLLRVKSVHPEWILTGRGPCLIASSTPGTYETEDMAQERRNVAHALRRLSSRELADELVRRVAMAQATAFIRTDPEIV